MELNHYNEDGFYTTTTTAKLDPKAQQPMIPARATAAELPVGTLESYQNYHFNGTAFSITNVQSIVDSMLAEKNEKETLLNEDDGFGNPVARTIEAIAADDLVYDKQILKSTAYSEMQTDIYDQLEATFGTRKSETATAMAMTWDLMKAEPNEYFLLNLKSDFTLAGISIGDVLDTEAKVLSYASQLVDSKLTYSKYRLGRIVQYNNEVAAIG